MLFHILITRRLRSFLCFWKKTINIGLNIKLVKYVLSISQRDVYPIFWGIGTSYWRLLAQGHKYHCFFKIFFQSACQFALRTEKLWRRILKSNLYNSKSQVDTKSQKSGTLFYLLYSIIIAEPNEFRRGHPCKEGVVPFSWVME